MIREWFTALELAECRLPDLPAEKSPMIRRAKRENWRSRPRIGRGGGLEYHVSALPETAQIKLALDARHAEAEPARDAPPIDRDTLWKWFAEAPEVKKSKARDRLAILDTIDTLVRGGVTKDQAVGVVAARNKVSPSTIYNWFNLVAGRDRTDWLPALAPRHAGRTATVDCDPAAWDMLKGDYLRLEQPPFADCYGRLKRAATAQGWTLPSERTLYRRIETTIHPAVITLARKGAEALKRMYPAQERDRSHFTAMEAVNADGHRWDVWVKWPDGEISRPCMVGFQDLFSGLILSWRIDRTENSWSVRLAVGDMIERYGIPKMCWLDNGRSFASKWLTGGIPNRYRFKVKDEEPAGILTNLGVEIHWTTPYAGQSKPIERAWRDLASDIARHPAFAGAYTGNSPVTKPENYRSKAIPIDKFEEIVASEINEHNMRAGRAARNCRGRSFWETFKESYATAPVTQATDEQRRLWLLAAEGVTVSTRDGSIRLFDNRYWADFLHLHMGETVAARFDPDFLHDGLHIYRLDGAYLGHAPVIEAAGFNNTDDAREHSRQRRRFQHAVRDMLDAQRRMSPEAVAALVPINLGPEAPPSGKVIALARPVLDLKQTPKPDLTEAQAAKREAMVVEFSGRAPEPAETDQRTIRLERAARIEAAIAAGEAVEPADQTWITGYRTTPEYRAAMRLAAAS